MSYVNIQKSTPRTSRRSRNANKENCRSIINQSDHTNICQSVQENITVKMDQSTSTKCEITLQKHKQAANNKPSRQKLSNKLEKTCIIVEESSVANETPAKTEVNKPNVSTEEREAKRRSGRKRVNALKPQTVPKKKTGDIEEKNMEPVHNDSGSESVRARKMRVLCLFDCYFFFQNYQIICYLSYHSCYILCN